MTAPGSLLLVVGLALTGVAAVFHGYVFVLESVLWLRPATRRTFRVASETDAVTTRPLALNQGFYNLFLAVMAVVGIVLLVAGSTTAGRTLVLASAACMAGAGLVLAVSDRRMLRAALLQAGPPLLGIVAILSASALG